MNQHEHHDRAEVMADEAEGIVRSLDDAVPADATEKVASQIRDELLARATIVTALAQVHATLATIKV